MSHVHHYVLERHQMQLISQFNKHNLTTQQFPFTKLEQ